MPSLERKGIFTASYDQMFRKFVIGEESRGLSVPIINRGSNPDNNSADGASGANDNDGSARSPRRSNKACIVDIPG